MGIVVQVFDNYVRRDDESELTRKLGTQTLTGSESPRNTLRDNIPHLATKADCCA